MSDPNKTGTFHLDELTQSAERIDAIRKADLRRGDQVLVKTRNSWYSIRVLGESRYAVSGGWFDRESGASVETTINGCTWGGKAIKSDIIAGRGLFLEFGNRVTTTRIQHVCLVRNVGIPVYN